MAGQEGLSVTKTIGGAGMCVLALSGRLNVSTAPVFQTELLSAIDEHKGLTLDMAELEYISSAGLRVLAMGNKKAQESEGELCLSKVTPEVMDILKMTRFSEIFTISY